MSRRDDRRLETVRQRLREGDPDLFERALYDDEVATMRQRVLAEARASEIPVRRREWRWAVSTVVVLAAVAAGYLWRSDRARSMTSEEALGVAVTPAAEGRTRQVNFVLPSGTRVVWVLDSEFSI